jgi:hypothetical protein
MINVFLKLIMILIARWRAVWKHCRFGPWWIHKYWRKSTTGKAWIYCCKGDEVDLGEWKKRLACWNLNHDRCSITKILMHREINLKCHVDMHVSWNTEGTKIPHFVAIHRITNRQRLIVSYLNYENVCEDPSSVKTFPWIGPWSQTSWYTLWDGYPQWVCCNIATFRRFP